MHKILVNVMREEIRMAVIDEEGQLVDFVLERTDESHMANHMYKGTVKNVLNGMQAAFVDIGGSQNAYLNLQQGKEQKILPRLSVGQQILVQVVKEEMLGKGARVTADVSLAGRFMVLLPYSEGMHISKKITDEAVRAKLQELAAPYVQEGCGFIIRTAAAKASADEIGRDMEYLWRTWQHVLKRFKVAKSGTDLYSDADFWFRLVRDYAHRNVGEIIVDSDMGESRLLDLLGHGPTSQQIKVTRHRGSTPIFKANHIEPQLEDLISRDINLPSGGSIRIEMCIRDRITTAQWNQLNNDKNHPFDNKVISGEYPPGSPFKIITGTAALDLKKVTPEEMIFDSGKHWLIDKRNAEGEALGWLNFNRALAKSDNVYFYEMGNRVGIENLDKYAAYFGIGEKTGINLPGEASGIMASPEYKRKVYDEDWYLGETFDAAIGQSFTLVTPLQMAVLLSEVANGGIKYKPYVVSRIDNKDGTPKEIFGPDKLGILPVPKNIMDLIREGLRDVTNEGGTAGDLFKGFPINVAGKTGTAENAHGRDHGWFVAYAPYDKPQIVVVALVEQGSFGAGSAGPIVRDVLAAYFNVPLNKKTNDTNAKSNKDSATVGSTSNGQKPQNAVTSGQPRKD